MTCPVGVAKRSGGRPNGAVSDPRQGGTNLSIFLYSWAMAILHDPREVTVTEAAQRGVAGLVADAEHGSDIIVTRRQRPVAAVVNIQRLTEMEQTLADLRDLALVLARSATDGGNRTSLDDVLSAFGHTRDTLDALPDDDD
ncbi:hypothetical protein GCM10027605_11660 [Micromonospora zhanjiangensis]